MLLLKNDKIQRWGTKIKDMEKDMVFLNLKLKVHFDPPTFQIINFHSLTIYDIQFWCQKFVFLIFLIFDLREER
jgi:hypothetical protein